jgi:hypothetical protein
MRRTVYITLATLGLASIATAAVMTEAPEQRVERRVQTQSTATSTTGEARTVASESETTETKKECRHRCPLFGD